jgi:hypothetical protein
MTYTEKCKELQRKLLDMGESNRVVTQAMRLKQEEISEVRGSNYSYCDWQWSKK